MKSASQPAGPERSEAPQISVIPADRLWLVDVAGLLYAISMHKFAMRDGLSSNTGIQGIIESLSITGAFVCIFTATRKARRQHTTSITALCFAMFGIFALCSSWRSFNPSLSFVKGVLFLVVLATGYLANQTGLAQRYFRSIYWSYTGLLVVGLVVGLMFPEHYPLLSVGDYTGKHRLSVFDTFSGTMGEDVALLLLLVPLIRARVSTVSQVFLFLMVVFAGGKTPTVLLCVLLLVRFVYGLRQWRSWRTVVVILGVAGVVAFTTQLLLGSGGQDSAFARPAAWLYGTHVAGEVGTLDGRVALWIASLDLLQSGQALGYGFEGARQAMINVASWSGNSHNGYLELALSGGLVGFVFFLVGLLFVGRDCYLARFPVRLNAALALSSILITDLIGPSFSFPSAFGMLVLLWISYEAKAHPRQVKKRSPLPAGSLPQMPVSITTAG
jgi:O-antigen ligase